MLNVSWVALPLPAPGTARAPTGGMLAVARDMSKAPDGPGMARQMADLYERTNAPRAAIRDIVACRDPKLLAFLWRPSTLAERLDILARLESLDPDFAMRLVERLRLLDDPEPKLRARAVRILAWGDGAEHAPSLTARLADPDARVRANAIEALAPRLGPADAFRLFEPMTRDAAARPRANAILALIRQGCMLARDGAPRHLLASPAVGAKASARWVLNQLLKRL